MKRAALIILVFLVIIINNDCFPQMNPPDPPSNHGENDNQPSGGGTPLGEGTLILTGLACAYIIRKMSLRKQKLKLEQKVK